MSNSPRSLNESFYEPNSDKTQDEDELIETNEVL